MTYQVDIRSRLHSSALSFALVAMLGLSACAGHGGPFDSQNHDFIDRKQQLSREDYRNMTAPKLHVPDEVKNLKPHYEELPPTAALGAAPIPQVSEILATPRPPQIGETQLVSLFVTSDVPLRDVLIELGRLADVDMEIDSSIDGGIVFRAQNRPFNEVMDRIAKLADLRYEMRDGVVRVERDMPRTKTYPIDFLSFDRTSTSGVTITTSVLSTTVGGGGGGGGGGGAGDGGGGGGGNQSLTTGSTAAINYSAAADFWPQFTAGLQQIVSQVPASRSLAVATEGAAAPTAAGGAGESQVVVNRQAGTVTVNAPERVHALVEDYLRKLRETAGAQVLIEAKIVEVTLDDRYESGVNWNEVFSSKFLTMDADFNNISGSSSNLSQIIIGGTGADDASLDAIIRLTQTFGTTRTLSSPRLHAMNNQQAVLTFARNLVYFDLSVEREQQVAGDTVLAPLLTVDAEPVTVPVGLIISMQPTINTKTNEVTLSIRPTLSRVIDYVPDPSVAFLLAQVDDDVSISNNIPQIEVRELDTLMRMRSGQIMVLGGLMEQVGENQDQGVPFLSAIPWIGNAFKAVGKNERVSELFILVKATIVGNNATVDPVDADLYRKFTTDHRPLAF